MNESTYKRLSRKVGLVVVGNVIYAMGVNLAINRYTSTAAVLPALLS